MLLINESSVGASNLVNREGALHIIYLLHLLSTNHKCTQPCYFPLLLQPTAQKEMDWNSSTMSSRLCVAPVVIPMVLWSLPLFHFVVSHLSL
jgi:hypothetical protein